MWKNNLYKHYRIRHLGVRHKCSGCGQQFSSRFYLNLHKTKCVQPTENRAGPNPCTNQVHSSMSPKSIDRLTIAQKNGSFACPHKNCLFTFKNRYSVMRHYKIIHMGHRVVCPKCNMVLTKLDCGHERTCKGNEELSIKYSNSMDYSNDSTPHLGKLTGITRKEVSNESILYKSKFFCTKCNVRFKYLSGLQVHRAHKYCEGKLKVQLAPVRQVKPSTDGRFYCPYPKCTKSGIMKNALVAHYKLAHLGVRYPCSKCGLQLTTSNSLHKHVTKCRGNKDLEPVRRATASGDGRFHCPCENCSFSSAVKYGLVSHYKVHHLGFRYKCSKCDREFMGSLGLKNHKAGCKGRGVQDLKLIVELKPAKDGLFHCPHAGCLFSCTSRLNLKIHNDEEHLAVKYQCSKCKRYYKYSSNLSAHEVVCKGREVTNPAHHVTPSPDGRWYCPFENCSRSFCLKSELVRHYQAEHLGVRYPCLKCGQEFKILYSLHTHKTACKGSLNIDLKPALQVTASRDGQFYCPNEKCSYSSKDQSGLVAHFKVEHIGIRYPCSKCGDRLKSAYSLSLHKTKCKGNIEKELKPVRQQGNRADGRFHCPYKNCSHSSTMMNGLVAHYKVEHLGVRYPCPTCGFKFKRSETMKKHRVRCDGKAAKVVKPVQCKKVDQNEAKLSDDSVSPSKDGHFYCSYQRCSASYSSNKTLEIHCKVVHQGVKFTCPLCSLQFTQKLSLTKHMLRCHGRKSKVESHVDPGQDDSKLDAVQQVRRGENGRFYCPKENCRTSYKYKNDLADHYKTIHLGIEYHCPECNGTFRDKKYYKGHIKICDGRDKDKKFWSEKAKCIREVQVDADGRFHCPVEDCTTASTQRCNLFRHYKVEHLGMRYSCSKCQEQFKDKKQRDKHESACTAGNFHKSPFS